MTSRRERVGWAVLFGLPMGVGVGVATAKTAGTSLADPLAVGAGGVVALSVAALVTGATGHRTDG